MRVFFVCMLSVYSPDGWAQKDETAGFEKIRDVQPNVFQPVEAGASEITVLSDVAQAQAPVTGLEPEPIPGLSVSPAALDFATLGGVQSFAVTSNREWTAGSSEPWATVSPATGSGDAALTVSVTPNTDGAARTATVTLAGGGLTQTVSITQEAKHSLLVTQAAPPVDGRGAIAVALNIPSKEMFRLTFTLTLPDGFVLDREATSLAPKLQYDHLFFLTSDGRGNWLFEILPNILLGGSLPDGDETAQQRLVYIAYKLDGSVAVGEYKVKIHDIDLMWYASGTEERPDETGVLVTVNENSLGVESLEASGRVYADGVLSVNTPQAERIEVYSAAGQLLHRVQKAAGAAAFDLNGLPRGVLIVRGSSGWVKKVVR